MTTKQTKKLVGAGKGKAKAFPRTALQVLVTKELLAKLPKLYATEKTPAEEKVAVAKYFCGPATWYATEFDGEDLFFGYVTGLGGDEWGNFSLRELAELNVPQPLVINGVTRHIPLIVERDLYWKPQTMAEALPSVFGTRVDPGCCPTCKGTDSPRTFTMVLGWECSDCRRYRIEQHGDPANRPLRAKPQESGRVARSKRNLAAPCTYDKQAKSLAAREVGCPLDHCACGTHDVDQTEHKCPQLNVFRCGVCGTEGEGQGRTHVCGCGAWVVLEGVR